MSFPATSFLFMPPKYKVIYLNMFCESAYNKTEHSSSFKTKAISFWHEQFLDFMVVCCSTEDQISWLLLIFWFISRWPHLAVPAHFTCTGTPSVHHVPSTRSARKDWNHFRLGKNDQLLCWEICGTLLWNQVLARSSLACKSRGSMVEEKNPPFASEGLNSEAKPGRNMPGILLHSFQSKVN